MRWLYAIWLILALGLCGTAMVGASASPPEVASEEDLAAKARQGRLTQDELIKKGENLSYFTRLKLYLYAKELEPFFEGVEDTFRALARSDPEDRAAMDQGRSEVYESMVRARERLMQSGREQPETDWRRGLVGLIWLDHEWRGRVYEKGKDEIKNPYDLVSLIDCLDAGLRGLEKGGYEQCPVQPKQDKTKELSKHEQLSE
jgi:hypothetical protein